ncbi:MAG: hypothetical protein HC877_09915 [Thioploca sp.]|nr:hypothetical protein [Thioploca sp.]
MISIRFLLWLVLFWVIWRLAQGWYHRFLENQQNNKTSPPITPEKTGVMVCCHYCHLHLLKEEALQFGDTYFCCEAHYHADQQQSDVRTH